MKLLCVLLSILIFATACHGQGKAQQKQFGANKPAGQAKLIKAHGSGPDDNVHCGIEDKSGNLWFGTTGDGVYRYDGRSFTDFTEKNGLNSNCVYSILEDKAGNIWVGTKDGLCRYDHSPAQGGSNSLLAGQARFTDIPFSGGNDVNAYLPATKILARSQTAVESMLQDKTGKIWFGTSDDGVYCYDGKSFTHFLHNDGVINKNGLRLDAVNSIIEDKQGNIWFATWFDGVCRYDGRSITNYKPNGEVWFSSVLEDKAGHIWAGRRDKGVCRYDGRTFTNVTQEGVFDSCGIGPIAEDKKGNIWIGTEFGDMTRRETMGGVWRYDGKSFKNFTTRDGLGNNAVFCILEDKAGNIWVGTRNTGLCRYNGKTFANFTE